MDECRTNGVTLADAQDVLEKGGCPEERTVALQGLVQREPSGRAELRRVEAVFSAQDEEGVADGLDEESLRRKAVGRQAVLGG